MVKKRSRIDLSDEELIKIVKNTKELEDVQVKDMDQYTVFMQWIRQNDIKNGNEHLTCSVLYSFFTRWCEIRNVKNVPYIQSFGRFLTQVIHKRRSNGALYYTVNKTTAELDKICDEGQEDQKETVEEEKTE